VTFKSHGRDNAAKDPLFPLMCGWIISCLMNRSFAVINVWSNGIVQSMWIVPQDNQLFHKTCRPGLTTPFPVVSLMSVRASSWLMFSNYTCKCPNGYTHRWKVRHAPKCPDIIPEGSAPLRGRRCGKLQQTASTNGAMNTKLKCSRLKSCCCIARPIEAMVKLRHIKGSSGE
jgi:hypothetical protein